MIYLVDSDALISAHRKFYKIQHFPSFWAWLNQQFVSKHAQSVADVQSELLKGGSSDPLTLWVKNNGGYFLSTSGQNDQQNLVKIINYVNNKYQKGQHLSNFINGADICLIAKAVTLKDGGSSVMVVTNEQSAPNSTRKVKIPDVCAGYGIPTITFFDFIYNLNINI
ncbi:MAG: DUF4411 family protein [Candidatus Puniceispirillaceae bacterium]